MTEVSLYRFYREDNRLLYVGISNDPFRRRAQHEASRDMRAVRHIEIEWHACDDSAAKAERLAIFRENPLWNISRPLKPRKCKETDMEEVEVAKVRVKKDTPWRHFALGAVTGVGDNLTYQPVSEESQLLRALRKGDFLHIAQGVDLTDNMSDRIESEGINVVT